MTLALDTALQIVPHANKELLAEVIKWVKVYAPKYGVTTTARLQCFIAQAAHETDSFKTLREYASGKAYEGRADLGNTEPGAGVKYKGRGIFQTTGKNNYLRVSRVIFGDDRLLTHPELLEQPQYAVQSAFIYWQDHNLNVYADKPDTWSYTSPKSGKTYNKFQWITKLINGGQNGLAERTIFFNRAQGILLA